MILSISQLSRKSLIISCSKMPYLQVVKGKSNIKITCKTALFINEPLVLKDLTGSVSQSSLSTCMNYLCLYSLGNIYIITYICVYNSLGNVCVCMCIYIHIFHKAHRNW